MSVISQIGVSTHAEAALVLMENYGVDLSEHEKVLHLVGPVLTAYAEGLVYTVPDFLLPLVDPAGGALLLRKDRLEEYAAGAEQQARWSRQYREGKLGHVADLMELPFRDFQSGGAHAAVFECRPNLGELRTLVWQSQGSMDMYTEDFEEHGDSSIRTLTLAAGLSYIENSMNAFLEKLNLSLSYVETDESALEHVTYTDEDLERVVALFTQVKTENECIETKSGQQAWGSDSLTFQQAWGSVAFLVKGQSARLPLDKVESRRLQRALVDLAEVFHRRLVPGFDLDKSWYALLSYTMANRKKRNPDFKFQA